MIADWMDDALCAQVNPDLFFPEPVRSEPARLAISICEACPVRDACLEYALVNDFLFGIYGGLVPRDRRKLRRKKV